jgi:valyl-tRNA synthetase
VNVVPKLKELQLETTEDDKIINKLIKLIENVNDCHNKLDTHELTSVLYNFTWNEFASGYLEYAKDKLSEERKNILSYVYYNILDMLYPIIPHITSEIKELLYKN